MRLLVTGANGFLGSAVVEAVRRRGHEVRALVRPAARAAWEGVEVVRADLRGGAPLGPAVDGVEAIIHLAANVRGDEGDAIQTAVHGTDRLLRAAEAAGVRRVVLASSVAVYDWHAAAGALTEESPLRSPRDDRNAYALTKLWQERLLERAGVERVVLRPGFIWGRGAEWVDGIGQRLGPLVVVPGPRRQLPLTHVENCAEWFVDAADRAGAHGRALNVFDTEAIRAWQLGVEWTTRNGGRLVPLPWPLAAGIVALAGSTSRRLFDGRGKLPSVLDPPRFEARFKPLAFPNDRLLATLGPQRLDFREALARTYGD